MHRFFVSGENIRGNMITMDPGEARHIERVLRLAAGDLIKVFDGSGAEYLVRLIGHNEDRLMGEIIETDYMDTEAAASLYLVQGIGKGDKMDTIVQKAVEIGIKAIYPLACERSVVRLEGDKAFKRVQRWQDIARESCKQCRRNIIPEVKSVMDFSQLWREIDGRTSIMLYENEKDLSLKAYLRERAQHLAGQEIFLLVGPEGGFSPQEAETARNYHCTTVTLGPRILRTETAGLAAASIILYELEELPGSLL